MAKQPDKNIRRGSSATVAKTEKTLNDVPRWVPPVVYLLITVILFREFLFGGANLLGTDTMALSYFARQFYTNFIHNFHRFPLWDPLLYGGMPFVDGMHGDIFYPPSIALFVFGSPERAWGWKMVMHIFFAGMFMYMWLREIGVSRMSALLGGLVFMMGADLVSLVFPGGDGKLFVSALAPLAFMFTERAARNRRIQDYAAFSLVLALVMFTSHMQAAYFLVWGISAYFIFRIVQEKAYPHIAAFVLAGVLGVGAAAIQFIPPLGYLREWSHRASKTEQAQIKDAYAYSTSYSLHPEEIMSLVNPDFVGDNAPTDTRQGNTYWGRNGFKLNHEYAGLLGLLLLPLLFLRRRKGQSWFFAALAVGALIYALGADTPFFRLFYSLVPGVKLFRAPSIIIFLYGFAIATIASLSVDELAERPDIGSRAIWVVPAVLLVLALGSGVLMNLWQNVIYKGMTQQAYAGLQANMSNIKTGFFLAFAVAAAFVIALEGTRWKIWSLRTAVIALCVIAFVEEYRVGAPFVRATTLMNATRDPSLTQADDALNFLAQRQASGEIFRAFDLGAYQQQNTFALHGIDQLGGHHGNEIGRYRELIGGPEPANINKSLSLLDITNTMYLVSPQAIQIPGFAEAFRANDGKIVYRKADVLPRAYLVGKTEVVAPEKAVERLLAQDFDFRRTATLDAPLTTTIADNPQGTIQWTSRAANAQELKVTSDKPALLVVLDNYYKQWGAKIDGKDAEILRANYTFRAVPIPAGTHTVTFAYVASNLKSSAIISIVIILTLLVLAVGKPLMAWKKQ